MPTAIVGPVTPTSSNPVTINAFIPITLTNTQSQRHPELLPGGHQRHQHRILSYEGSLLQNVEFFTDANPLNTVGTVIPSWLESGNSNTATNTVYWVRLPEQPPRERLARRPSTWASLDHSNLFRLPPMTTTPTDSSARPRPSLRTTVPTTTARTSSTFTITSQATPSMPIGGLTTRSASNAGTQASIPGQQSDNALRS